MNYYGEMAQQSLGEVAPAASTRRSRIRTATSRDLGSRVEARIDELADQLAGDAPPGEGYLARAGRIGQARRQAEEIVLTEMVLLEPEPGTDQETQPG